MFAPELPNPKAHAGMVGILNKAYLNDLTEFCEFIVVLISLFLFCLIFQAASIVRTVALAFKAIGKLRREKIERESRRAKRTHSISSSERTRTNSEVSTTSTVGSSSVDRRHPHVQWKHGETSGRRSPHGKKLNKSTTSPSILRHPTSSFSSGRHVEFSALSPVPSDGSDSDGKEPNQSKKAVIDVQCEIQADVHALPPSMQPELPVWVKRVGNDATRRSSLPIMEHKRSVVPSDGTRKGQSYRCHSVEEIHSQPAVAPNTKDKPHVNSLKNMIKTSPESAETASKEPNELLEKGKFSREQDYGRIGKDHVTENFLATTLFPTESFHKESTCIPSSDCVSLSLGKYKGLEPQDMTLPLSENEEEKNPETLHSLITAVEKGNTGLVEQFLQNGLSVNLHDTSRRSLLYYAVSLGDVEMTQFLLKR